VIPENFSLRNIDEMCLTDNDNEGISPNFFNFNVLYNNLLSILENLFKIFKID
jgi:hypothetical protein